MGERATDQIKGPRESLVKEDKGKTEGNGIQAELQKELSATEEEAMD